MSRRRRAKLACRAVTEVLEPRRLLAGDCGEQPCEDFYDVVEDGALIVTAPGVLENDFDPAATLNTFPSVDPANGVVELAADGSFLYTPNADFFGEDMFSYEVEFTDSTGNLVISSAVVHIDVIGVNDPPIGTGGDNGDDPSDAYTIENIFEGTDEERLTTIEADAGVLANDSDPEGVDLIAILDTEPANGVLAFREDGSFDYTPDELFFGDDTFTYFSSDGELQLGPVTVTLTVTLNPPLTAHPDEYTTLEDVPLVIGAPGVLGNDEYAIPDPITGGLVGGVPVGDVFFQPDGSFTYTPLENWSGDDSWTYVAQRGMDDPPLSSVGQVLIHVIPVDDPAVGGPDEYHLLEGGEFSVGLYDYVDGEPAYFPANSSYYQYVEQVVSWQEAVDAAEALSLDGRPGRLALVDAPEITRFFQETLTPREAWIAGVQDLDRLTPEDAELEEGEVPVTDPTGGWTWLGRQDMDYANWGANRPSHVDLETPDGAAINPDFDPPPEGDPWHWVDLSVDELLSGYYVEFRTRDRPTEGLLINDTDVEGDPIGAELADPPPNGVLHEFTVSGGFHYQPQTGFFGEDVFTYLPTWNGVAGDPTEVKMVVHQLQDIPGDANFDEKVDLEDFNILKENFGTGIWPEQGDANVDGKVDLADFALLKANFGTGVEDPEEGEGDGDEGDGAAPAAVAVDARVAFAVAIDALLAGDDSEDDSRLG